MQLYELKEIQSEEDLPKEEGRYWVEIKGQEDMEEWQYFPQYEDLRKVWMDKVRSYFSPVSVEKETVYVKSDDYHDTELYLWSVTYQDWHPDSYLKQSEVLIVKQ